MKKRISRKKTAVFTLTMCLSLAFPAALHAETTLVSASKSGASNFTANWTATAKASYSGSTETLGYGFNKFLINEDIAHAYSNGSIHRARIKNGNGTHQGPRVTANNYSDLEVRHSGDSVFYYSIQVD